MITTNKVKQRFAVGLDLSVTSPGWAIYDLERDKWQVFAFNKLVRDAGAQKCTDRTIVKILPALPSGDVERYKHIQEHILRTICEIIPEEFRAMWTTIGIEAYCFSTREKSGNNFKLHESGGVIKYALDMAGFKKVISIVGSSWKLNVTGHGVRSKMDIIKFMTTNGPCVNFLEFLGYNENDLPLKDGIQKVPSPSQDLADACGVCMALFMKPAPRLPRKPRKVPIKAILDFADCIKEAEEENETNTRNESFWKRPPPDKKNSRKTAKKSRKILEEENNIDIAATNHRLQKPVKIQNDHSKRDIVSQPLLKDAWTRQARMLTNIASDHSSTTKIYVEISDSD